jgi:exonuclease SbcC
MQPLTLTLKGFRGIRDGLGRDMLTLDFERLADGAQLIAIAGANGRGKTTVMDNMHPYLTMPSRAAVAGPGGFSYYDHVCLPESEKDLTWAHEGRSYRSQVVVRLNGRRKTEAFLFVLAEHGTWVPVVLADGTVSDGKVDTYARCVEALCGPADTFFTSVFSAQGKRQLSTYRNAEIKTLLADLLGQEEIRVIGQKAGETARLLKAGLLAIRHESSGLDAEHSRLAADRLRLDGAAGRVEPAVAALRAAQSALEAGQSRHITLAAERDQSKATEERRAQLHAERQLMLARGTEATQALQGREQGERARLQGLEQRIAQRRAQANARWQALQQSRRQCLATLAMSGAVWRAITRQPLASRLQALSSARTAACRQQVQRLAQCQAAEKLAEQKLQGIDREAGKAALRAEELAHRFGLTREVPCAGTDLQGQCKLLGDAREAQSLIPSASGQIAALARDKAQVQDELAAIRQQRDPLQGAPQALRLAERREEAARERASRFALLAAKEAEMAQAETTLASVDRELAALDLTAAGADSPETPDERAERQRIAAAGLELSEERKRHAQRLQEGLGRIDALLAALPAPFDERRLSAAAQAVADARQAVAAADRAHLAAARDAQALDALSQQIQSLAQRRVQVDARVAHVEAELGGWNLFARCMSNDGLIALAIDDAGPTLSGLANDLLLACYGPRFTVSIHTLVETGKGEQREGFDIVVHDGESGESKSVGLMSGGERVWVNESLTRAVALYLAQHSGRRYTTLFCDEADGALDPDRKRMFMAMKREVLRLGGYEREFFVSQTPELTAMADAVIDLDALHTKARASPVGVEA